MKDELKGEKLTIENGIKYIEDNKINVKNIGAFIHFLNGEIFKKKLEKAKRDRIKKANEFNIKLKILDDKNLNDLELLMEAFSLFSIQDLLYYIDLPTPLKISLLDKILPIIISHKIQFENKKSKAIESFKNLISFLSKYNDSELAFFNEVMYFKKFYENMKNLYKQIKEDLQNIDSDKDIDKTEKKFYKKFIGYEYREGLDYIYLSKLLDEFFPKDIQKESHCKKNNFYKAMIRLEKYHNLSHEISKIVYDFSSEWKKIAKDLSKNVKILNMYVDIFKNYNNEFFWLKHKEDSIKNFEKILYSYTEANNKKKELVKKFRESIDIIKQKNALTNYEDYEYCDLFFNSIEEQLDFYNNQKRKDRKSKYYSCLIDRYKFLDNNKCNDGETKHIECIKNFARWNPQDYAKMRESFEKILRSENTDKNTDRVIYEIFLETEYKKSKKENQVKENQVKENQEFSLKEYYSNKIKNSFIDCNNVYNIEDLTHLFQKNLHREQIFSEAIEFYLIKNQYTKDTENIIKSLTGKDKILKLIELYIYQDIIPFNNSNNKNFKDLFEKEQSDLNNILSRIFVIYILANKENLLIQKNLEKKEEYIQQKTEITIDFLKNRIITFLLAFSKSLIPTMCYNILNNNYPFTGEEKFLEIMKESNYDLSTFLEKTYADLEYFYFYNKKENTFLNGYFFDDVNLYKNKYANSLIYSILENFFTIPNVGNIIKNFFIGKKNLFYSSKNLSEISFENSSEISSEISFENSSEYSSSEYSSSECSDEYI